MAITEDASAPPSKDTAGNGVATTATFSPPAKSLIVVMVCGEWGSASPTVAVTDSTGGGTWSAVTIAPAVSFRGIASVAYKYFASAQSNMTISATFTNIDSGAGSILTTKVLQGAAPTPGVSATATITPGSSTQFFASLTPSRAGSMIYGATQNSDHDVATWTPNANSTLIAFNNVGSSPGGEATFKSSSATGSPGTPTTYGLTASSNGQGGVAILEVLPTTDAGSASVSVTANAPTVHKTTPTVSVAVTANSPSVNAGTPGMVFSPQAATSVTSNAPRSSIRISAGGIG